MKKLLILLTLGLMFGQTKMETRYYEIQLTSWEEDFSLYDITGESIDFAMINILGLKDIGVIGGTNISWEARIITSPII